MRARDPSRAHCAAPQCRIAGPPLGRVNPEFGFLAVIAMPQFTEIARDDHEGGAARAVAHASSAPLRGEMKSAGADLDLAHLRQWRTPGMQGALRLSNPANV